MISLAPGSDSDDAQPTVPSPPRLTAKQKGKGRVIGNQPPTPAHPQQQKPLPQRKSHPGPNVQARRAGERFEGNLPVLDQQQDVQRRGDSSESRRKHQKAKEWWTHLGKEYGMKCGAWIAEPELTKALTVEDSQDLDDPPYWELIALLDAFEVQHSVRKDPQFQAHVRFSLLPSITF